MGKYSMYSIEMNWTRLVARMLVIWRTGKEDGSRVYVSDFKYLDSYQPQGKREEERGESQGPRDTDIDTGLARKPGIPSMLAAWGDGPVSLRGAS
jgi:hypothetical protein